MRKRSSGFTLIELMITVTVVAILVAIGLPNYREHVRKSTRSEAQSYMMAVAGRQQQFLVDTKAYGKLADVGVATPANVSTAYTIAMPEGSLTASPPSFLLTLTPVSDQMQEKCGTLTIDNTGAKTAKKGGTEVSGCW